MILVTGATGNVGKELVGTLLDRGQHVRVFTRDAQRVAHLAGRVEAAVGDFDRPETVTAALQGVQRLFLVTTSTQQEKTVLAAAREAGVRHVVKLSVLQAGEPIEPISAQHHAREQLIQASGLAWTFLRPGQFMSNALQWVPTIKAQGAVYSATGDGRVAPIDPRDVASVATVALTEPGHEGRAYQLTGPELLSARDQVAILSQLLDRPIQCVEIPLSVAGQQMRQAGMPEDVVEGIITLMRRRRDGTLAQRTGTTEQMTGHAPRTFETWCRDHLAAFR